RAALHRRERHGRDGQAAQGRAGAAQPALARDPAQAGGDHPALPAQGPAGALRLGRGAAARPGGAELTAGAELEVRVQEYETMLEIGAKLAATLDLSTVLEIALENAEQVCRAETSSIWELDEERQELFFRLVRGRAAGEIRGLRVPIDYGIVGSVARSGEAEVVNDVTADPRWKGDPQGVFQTRAILAVPLVAHGKVMRAVQLLNPGGNDP